MDKITGKSIIRDIIQKYPKTSDIFDKYGLMECGGPKGPIEPISFFARVHEVEETILIEELNSAISDYAE